MADLCGTSPQMISKNVKLLKLNRLPDGKFDTEDPMNRLYLIDRTEKERENTKNEQVETDSVTERADPVRKIKQNRNFRHDPNLADDAYSERDWKIQKLKWDAENSRLKAETEQGKLVERDLVEALFYKIGTIMNNDLLQRGERNAAIIAGKFEIADAEKVIEIRHMLEEDDMRTIKAIKSELKQFSKEMRKRAKEIRRGAKEEV